jgi:hypothetical protein
MTALSASPDLPLAGSQIRVSFTGTDSATTHIRLYATDAPVGSEIYEALQKTEAGEIVKFNAKKTATWLFEPDKGGKYSFRIQEVVEGNSSASRFDGDTIGASSPVLGASTSDYVSVGEAMTFTLGQSPDTADLKLCIWDDTVRETTLSTHGFPSPVIESHSSIRAEAAALNSTLRSLVIGLKDDTANTIVGGLDADFLLVKAAVNAHLAATGSIHSNTDTLRALGDGYGADTDSAAEQSINALRQALSDHMGAILNTATTPVTTHDSADGKSAAQFSGASQGRSTHYLALADTIVTLESHKANTGAHGAADAAPTVTGISVLLQICAAWWRAMRLTSPLAPSGRNTGAATLEQLGGFAPKAIE